MVLYHRNCPSGDGFGAAFAAWMSLGDTAIYVPADYGDMPPAAKGLDVFILDLSFPAEVLQRLSEEASSLTLLDHHVTAERKLSGFKPVCCGKIHFDLTKCGSVLAWEHFHPGKPLPALFRHLNDRDLWEWKHVHSAPYLAWLDCQDKSFERWAQILQMTDSEEQQALAMGSVLLHQKQQLAESMASKSAPVRIGDHAGLMVNASGELRSEVGTLLAQKSGTFGLVWRVAEDGSVLCSLRSLKGEGSVDVEQIALQFGGGGHPTSASFKLSATALPELAHGVIRA